MPITHLSAIDLNLMPALQALLRHAHVTRAGAAAGLSQPAMSRALQRLRDILDDPLLERVGRGWRLTPRAVAMAPQVEAAMAALRLALAAPEDTPAESRRRFTIAATDAQTILLAPRLMARLAERAPHMSIEFRAYRDNLAEAMAQGEVDFAFALSTTPLRPGLESLELARDPRALVLRAGHPKAQRVSSLQEYAQLQHVMVSIFGDETSEIDARLAASGLNRMVALRAPHFAAALASVAQTDLAFVCSAALARHFARAFDLELLPPPFADLDERMTLISMGWRRSDALLGWLRTQIADCARAVYAAGT